MVKADSVTSEGLRDWKSGCLNKWQNSSIPPIWLLVSLVLINKRMSHWASGLNSSCQSLGQNCRGWWVRSREPYPAKDARRLGWEQRLTGVHWWWALGLPRVNRNSLLDMDCPPTLILTHDHLIRVPPICTSNSHTEIPSLTLTTVLARLWPQPTQLPVKCRVPPPCAYMFHFDGLHCEINEGERKLPLMLHRRLWLFAQYCPLLPPGACWDGVGVRTFHKHESGREEWDEKACETQVKWQAFSILAFGVLRAWVSGFKKGNGLIAIFLERA